MRHGCGSQSAKYRAQSGVAACGGNFLYAAPPAGRDEMGVIGAEGTLKRKIGNKDILLPIPERDTGKINKVIFRLKITLFPQ